MRWHDEKEEEVMHRFICPHCLRTFLEESSNEGWICWKCGDETLCIGEFVFGQFKESTNELHKDRSLHFQKRKHWLR